MRSNRRMAAVAVAAALALLAGACGGDDDGGDDAGDAAGAKITIGAFNFSESEILARIYGGALEAGGATVTIRPNLGSREVVEPALEKGEIDMYPGYAATELEFLNKGAGEATPDPAATVTKLNAAIKAKGLEALTPSPAIDANAFAVTKATADRLKLKKLSDLAPVAGQLVLGGPPECPTRPFCGKGLKDTYGLTFKDFKALDPGGPLTKAALDKGDIDVGLIFSSDGAIAAKGYVVLEDDKKLQNADNVVPVIRTAAATAAVKKTLDAVSAKLTTAALAELNKKADLDKEDPETLAAAWLKDNGFTK